VVAVGDDGVGRKGEGASEQALTVGDREVGVHDAEAEEGVGPAGAGVGQQAEALGLCVRGGKGREGPRFA
jgi:hypothetical protein